MDVIICRFEIRAWLEIRPILNKCEEIVNRWFDLKLRNGNLIRMLQIGSCRMQRARCSVGGWVGWGSRLDTADTGTVLDSDLDVSVVTPGCTPGVLDKVVGSSVLDSVSDGEDTVVEGGSAGSASEDTGGVHLEGGLVGLDGDGDWLLGEGGLELVWGVLGDVSVGADGDLTLGKKVGLAGSSGAITGGVWVDGFLDHGVALGVLEGLVHKTTVATKVLQDAVVALNELLLREGKEFSRGDEVSTLEGTGGGEGPAGSALSLVLHWSDGTGGDPVDGVGGWGVVLNGAALSGEVLEASEAVELAGVPGGELVVGEGVGVGWVGVDSLDLGVNLGEDLLSGVEFLNGGPGKVVGGDVSDELEVDGREHGKEV